MKSTLLFLAVGALLLSAANANPPRRGRRRRPLRRPSEFL